MHILTARDARRNSGMKTTAADVPTFSVVIPAYNSAETIGSTIRSVQRQTRSDFEIIVVDDVSTDATPSVVQEFLADERITLATRDRNGGESAARNTGIARARGRYVCLLDSDDLWLPRYLEVMARTLDADPGAAVAYTDAWVLYDRLRRIYRQPAMAAWRPPVTPTDPEGFLRALLEYGNFVYCSTTVRRHVLLEVGGYDETLPGSPDYELWLRLSAAGHAFVDSGEILAIYRRRPGQLTADPGHVRRAVPEILRLVVTTYDIPDDVRALAQQRLAERLRAPTDEPAQRWRPPLVSGPDGVLARLRGLYFRPPASVREAFPDLHEV
jgi:hypothetical protein